MKINSKRQHKKHFRDILKIVTIITLIVFIIGIVCIAIFYRRGNKELEPMKLKYIKKENIDVTLGNNIKKNGVRLYINDFALDIDYKLVDKHYSFKINKNVISIDAKDGSYTYRAIQLDNKPYVSVITDKLANEYSTLLNNVYDKYGYTDENSRKEMQAFYSKHNINRLAHFQTLTTKERLKLINNAFNLNLNKFNIDSSYCNFEDCTWVFIINHDSTVSEIKLYTRAKDNCTDRKYVCEDKKYYGTFLIYQKYIESENLLDSVDFSNDFSMK